MGPLWWKCLSCGASGGPDDWEAHFEVVDEAGRYVCRITPRGPVQLRLS